MAQQHAEQQRVGAGAPPRLATLLLHVWRSRLWVLFLVCFIFSLGLSAIVPVLPALATNYFASKRAGRPLDCEAFALEVQPPECQAAHADAVQWSSLNSLAANCFIAFLFSPLVGDLSDSWGRRPFILAGLALNLLPLGMLWLHISRDASLLWYYPLNAVTAAVSPIIAMLSYAADVLPPQLRTSGFGLVTASFSCGYMIGPMALGGNLDPEQAALAAGALLLVSVLLVLLGVPESKPPTPAAAAGGGAGLVLSPAGAAAAHRRRSPLDVLSSLGRSWQLINSSSLFRRLAVCMAVVGIVSEGIQDMLLQYLQLTLNFSTADTTVLITVLGAGNFFVQALLLPHLAALLGERRLLLAGQLFSVLEQVLLTLAATKWQAMAAVSLSAFAGLSFPAISSLKSTHASAEQQGLVQGALAGIRALSAGLGPLVLAQLFAASTTASAALGYHPAAVFIATCALTGVAAAIAASIPEAAARIPCQGEHLLPSAGACSAAERAPQGSCADCMPAWVQDVESADCRKQAQHDAPALDQAAVESEAAVMVGALAACGQVGAPPAAQDLQATSGLVRVLVQLDDDDDDDTAGCTPEWRQSGNSSNSSGSMGQPHVEAAWGSYETPPASPLLRAQHAGGVREPLLSRAASADSPQ